MEYNSKLAQSKCRSLLREYEDLIKEIIEEEERKLERSSKLGNSFFEIAKDKIYNMGVREGMRKVLAKINEYANTD